MKLYRFSLKITSFLLICISTGMLLISLLYKAIYRYDDSPAFIRNGLGDLIALLILLLLFALGYHWREKINRYFSVKYSILIYFILAIFFVLLVPLKPFSDMQQIYQASLEVSKDNWKYFCKDISYFTQYPNNLLITLLYGFLFVVLPKNVLVLKVLNILEIIGIVWISEKTVQLYHKNSYRNLFFVYGLSLISVFLYTNHIYTDLLFVFFSVLGLYLYMKNPAHIGYAIALYSILFFVRPQAVFYIIAILLHYFFKGNASMIKKISHIICLILLFLVCRFAITNAIEKPLIGDLSHSMPAASYVYMAFNEEEFGFQDGTHDITAPSQMWPTAWLVTILKHLLKSSVKKWNGRGPKELIRHSATPSVKTVTPRINFPTPHRLPGTAWIPMPHGDNCWAVSCALSICFYLS